MKYYVSKKRMLLAWLGSIFFASIGLLCLYVPDPDLSLKLCGLLLICFGGLGVIIIPFRLFRSDQYLEIDDHGIFDHRLSPGFLIPWEDIRKVWVVENVNRRVTTMTLYVDLKDAAPYKARLSRISRFLMKLNPGMSDTYMIFGISNLSESYETVMNYIKSIHPEKLL